MRTRADPRTVAWSALSIYRPVQTSREPSPVQVTRPPAWVVGGFVVANALAIVVRRVVTVWRVVDVARVVGAAAAVVTVSGTVTAAAVVAVVVAGAVTGTEVEGRFPTLLSAPHAAIANSPTAIAPEATAVRPTRLGRHLLSHSAVVRCRLA